MKLSIKQKHCVSLVSLLLTITFAVAIAGCGSKAAVEKPPQTYLVKGRILGKGGQPVAIGEVTFSSKSPQQWLARATLKPDGSFALETLVDGKAIPGVIAGQHDVTYYPPMSEAQTEVPITLPLPIAVEARNDQELTIDLGQL